MRNSRLSEHKKEKKKLIPPLGQVGMTPSSWIDSRLPDVLWAVLIVNHFDRDKSLEFFRYVAKYAEDHKMPDMTLSGIGVLTPSKRADLIQYMLCYSSSVKEALSPMTFYENLPGRKEWVEALEEQDKQDINPLVVAVERTLWHQSQEATDCRWVLVLCAIAGGKVKFVKDKEKGIDLSETGKEIVLYPNYGDLKKVRPSIRSMEMALRMGETTEWANLFWKESFDRTKCYPEELFSKKIENRREELQVELEEIRKFYFEHAKDLRNKLIDHYLDTMTVTAINARHDAVFGIALYAITIFIEMCFYRMPLSISSRLAIRTIFESYALLKYMHKKEIKDSMVWDTYRGYGAGQFKLLLSKMKEQGFLSSMLNEDEIDYIANEDLWIEFRNIDLGNWDGSSLRDMAEFTGVKDLYDIYYDYTSAYSHANWGSVRESVLQRCVNPLHRRHRVPIYDLPLLNTAMLDGESLVNLVLDEVSALYPEFRERLNYKPSKND